MGVYKVFTPLIQDVYTFKKLQCRLKREFTLIHSKNIFSLHKNQEF